MKTSVFANQKGGVGKSAIETQFAYFLTGVLGKRIINIDLDHQKNASKAIIKSGKAAVAPFTASDLLNGKASVDALPKAPFVLVQGDDDLSLLESKPDQHNNYVNALNDFLSALDGTFDGCLIDTNPNPDIRYAAALITSDFIVSPIELNQEALDGIGGLLNHKRYGFKRIKATINPNLELIGILPNKVEPTPFQRGNFEQLAESFSHYLISINGDTNKFAFVPKRSAIAEAQAEGAFIGEVKKTAARDAWREIKPTFQELAARMGFGE